MNNLMHCGSVNHPGARRFERGASREVFRTKEELDNSITSIFSNLVTLRGTEEMTFEAYFIVNRH
jgi:hypothetical protein